MKNIKSLKIRLISTGIVAVLILAKLAWDYFHGGVPTHHIYILENKPGISNWWGAISMPLLTWIVVYRVQYRVYRMGSNNSESDTKPKMTRAFYGFLGALLFGIIFSYNYMNGPDIKGYLMLVLLITSFFTPLYKSEYMLGFVVGMTSKLGPILPIGIALLLMTVFAVTYKYIRSGMLHIASMIKG